MRVAPLPRQVPDLNPMAHGRHGESRAVGTERNEQMARVSGCQGTEHPTVARVDEMDHIAAIDDPDHGQHAAVGPECDRAGRARWRPRLGRRGPGVQEPISMNRQASASPMTSHRPSGRRRGGRWPKAT